MREQFIYTAVLVTAVHHLRVKHTLRRALLTRANEIARSPLNDSIISQIHVTWYYIVLHF